MLCRRLVSASVYFSYGCSSEVITEKDAERKGINERTGVIVFVLLFRARTLIPWWQIWHYVGGGLTSNAQLLWSPAH